MELIIGLIAVIIVVYLSAQKWDRSIKAVLVLVVIEGALRKWLLPQASDLMYFLKDFVLLGAYLNYYSKSRYFQGNVVKNSLIKLIISLIGIWCFFQAFNPSLGSPIVGFFGLRGYLFYIPLMWIVPNLFQSEEELYNFLRWYLILVIPVGLLGIAQFFSPPSSPINVYAPGEVEGVATFGGSTRLARVTGTFSYLSGYAVYLGVCFGLLISLLSINQVKKWQIITVFELFLVVVNSLMTGSRSVVFANILFLLGYLTIRIFSQPGSTLNLIQKLFIPGIAISIAAFIWFRPAIDAFWGRATTNTDLTERVGDSFSEPFKFTKYKNLDGYGTGAAHQATPVLRKALNLPRGEFIPTYFEGETGRIALELGPIGFCLWYFMKLVIAFNLLRLFFKLKRPFLRQLTLSAFLTHGIRINGLTVFHHTFSVYYWFLAGFIFLLPRLEKLACWQEYQQLQQLWQFYEQSSDLSSSPDE